MENLGPAHDWRDPLQVRVGDKWQRGADRIVTVKRRGRNSMWEMTDGGCFSDDYWRLGEMVLVERAPEPEFKAAKPHGGEAKRKPYGCVCPKNKRDTACSAHNPWEPLALEETAPTLADRVAADYEADLKSKAAYDAKIDRAVAIFARPNPPQPGFYGPGIGHLLDPPTIAPKAPNTYTQCARCGEIFSGTSHIEVTEKLREHLVTSHSAPKAPPTPIPLSREAASKTQESHPWAVGQVRQLDSTAWVAPLRVFVMGGPWGRDWRVKALEHHVGGSTGKEYGPGETWIVHDSMESTLLSFTPEQQGFVEEMSRLQAPQNPHDFSDPYLTWMGQPSCKACGGDPAAPIPCKPQPGWREHWERAIAFQMTALAAQASSGQTFNLSDSEKPQAHQSHLLGNGMSGVWNLRGR